MKIGENKIKLNEYEMWIESEIEKGNFVPVDDLDGWKEALQKAACRALEEKKIRLTIEMSSQETKDEIVKLLKDHFGKKVKVLE